MTQYDILTLANNMTLNQFSIPLHLLRQLCGLLMSDRLYSSFLVLGVLRIALFVTICTCCIL